MNLDLDNIDHSEAAEEFHSENANNIWNQPEEKDDESDIPAFLRRRKHKKDEPKAE